jgi:hypothetical protein
VTPLAPLAAPFDLSVGSPRTMGVSPLPAPAAWLSVAVLALLAVRSAARLTADRAPVAPGVPVCGRTSRAADAIHLAMAAGMVPMAVPLGVPPSVLVAFFSATTAFVAGTWLWRGALRRLAGRRGVAVACRPAHALEPHHVIVGLSMIVMARHMAAATSTAGTTGTAGMTAMAAMPGMIAPSSWLTVSSLALIYIWTAVVFLGGGLAKAASAQPIPTSAVALLAAPVTVYACELAMTVVMGLMLLG